MCIENLFHLGKWRWSQLWTTKCISILKQWHAAADFVYFIPQFLSLLLCSSIRFSEKNKTNDTHLFIV